MRYWKYPTKFWQWPLFIFGAGLFYLLIPLWYAMCHFKWKDDSMFIMVHMEAVFYNPWELWK